MGSTDTTAAGTAIKGHIVCELDASSRGQMLLDDAIARCKETGADLFVVWILEPRMLDTPYPRSSGAVGGWGLPHVLHAAVERAHAEGIARDVGRAVRQARGGAAQRGRGRRHGERLRACGVNGSTTRAG